MHFNTAATYVLSAFFLHFFSVIGFALLGVQTPVTTLPYVRTCKKGEKDERQSQTRSI